MGRLSPLPPSCLFPAFSLGRRIREHWAGGWGIAILFIVPVGNVYGDPLMGLAAVAVVLLAWGGDYLGTLTPRGIEP